VGRPVFKTHFRKAEPPATLPALLTHKRRSALDQGRLNVRSRISVVAETPERRRREVRIAQGEAEGGTLGRLVL